MSRPAQRFLVGFAAAAVVVGGALVLVGSGDGSESEDLGPASSTSQISATSAVSSTDPVTTDATTTTDTSAVADSLPPLRVLPLLDVDELCVQTYGAGTEVVDAADGPPQSCRTEDGEDRPLDTDSGCEARWGSGLRSVWSVEADGRDVWKCVVADRVELGSPDWQSECERRHGPEAIAFVAVDGSTGWACASVVNGIFLELEVGLDQACQVRFGPDTFGIAARAEEGASPDDTTCYGAAA